MRTLDLGGIWNLKIPEENRTIPGYLPGCNYLDLISSGNLEDPFWDRNEEKASEIAKKEYVYERFFTVEGSFLEEEEIRLSADGVDTLAEIYLNDYRIVETKNAHRTYQKSVKKYLHTGENSIRILFHSPYPYMERMNEEDPIASMGNHVKGLPYLRKPQCHFGWDWGPNVPPVGISGGIRLEAWHQARLEGMEIIQKHEYGQVAVTVIPELQLAAKDNILPFMLSCKITDPNGIVQNMTKNHNTDQPELTVLIEKPMLWWSNGLGEQNLYQVILELYGENGELLGSEKRWIGLRTIELNTDQDEWGNNFQFRINGVPLFIKGADWIPPDSFITRADRDVLDFYVKSAKEANMNMLRIWGGGYYGSDDLYDLCDRHGILVWQDFMFACAGYPFYDKEFLKNVRLEVRDNVRRLRHHASLAVWCGNNEIELMAVTYKNNKKLFQSGMAFYHKHLPLWVRGFDKSTPYWPGSPSSGKPGKKANDLNRGDTHLWQVWHGMRPIEAFQEYSTRFCTEFGMEAFPTMETIRTFTDCEEPDILDPTMLAHQKSVGGNQKILYYMLAKFREPEKFEDFVYLSQIVQAETICKATETWRRQFGRCNGALYWQYNDCWPVASWAGIDYGRRYKALQYLAKRFNRMCAISFVQHKERLQIYVHNEYPQETKAAVHWKMQDMDGAIIAHGIKQLKVKGCSVRIACSLNLKGLLRGVAWEDIVVTAELERETEEISEWCDRKTHLLLPDRKVNLKKTEIVKEVVIHDKLIELTLTSPVFARYVEVKAAGVNTPLSDNYFDMEGGKPYQITFAVPEGCDWDNKEWENAISIKSLADVESKNSAAEDKIKRLKIMLDKQSILYWAVFHFI